MFEHGNAIKDEAESGEVGENWVRESDSRNGIELRTSRSAMNVGGRSDVGLTKGSLLYQLANRETTKNDATRSDSLTVESSTML